MNDITITVKLFGSFRQYGETLCFTVPAGSSVTAIKDALKEKTGNALVNDSAMANDNTVLPDNTIFNEDTALAILPPVCGG